MNLQLIVSLLEVFYLSYMFYFFKTGIDFNIISSPDGDWFKHLIGDEVGLRICLFGRFAIIPLLILLLIRNFVTIPQSYISGVLIIAFILSLMNMNALIYLLPVIIVETFTVFYGYDALTFSSSDV